MKWKQERGQRINRGNSMTEKTDERELVIFLELLMPHVIQVQTLTQLLLEKGIFTKEEYLVKRKQVQEDYDGKLRTGAE